MKKRLFRLVAKIFSFVLMMGAALKAQAGGITFGNAGSTNTPIPTPAVVAQFTALADYYYKSDSSRQVVTVAGCAASSLDYSSLNDTLFLNLYDNHTFALGIDDTLTTVQIFAFPVNSVAADQRTILTGIWAPINSSNTKFRLNPGGDLAIPSDGWRHIANWVTKYACLSAREQFFAELGLGSFKVITADITAKSTTTVAGTPVPVGAASLSLAFEGYAKIMTGIPTNTSTPTPTATSTATNTPTATETPTATATNTNTQAPSPNYSPTPNGATSSNTPTPSWTPSPTKNYTPTPNGATSTPSPTKRPTATPASTTTATPTLTPPTLDTYKKVTYKLTARGAWRPTLTPSPTPSLEPNYKLVINGEIISNNVLGNQVPIITAKVDGVTFSCNVISTSYQCNPPDYLIDKPVQSNFIYLSVSNYTRSTSNQCYNNQVTIINKQLPIESENGVVVADATTLETTTFKYNVGVILSAVSVMSGYLTFTQTNTVNSQCVVVTPTPTLTPISTSTPTPTP